MNSTSKWLAAWPIIPLLLASSGVVARLLSPGPRTPALPPAPARAFEPPALFLSAAHGAGVAEEFTAGDNASRARLQLANGLGALEYELRGRLRLSADESLGACELHLTPIAPNTAQRRPLRVLIGAAPAHSSPIPGLHAASPSGRATSDGESVALQFRASWMRLPGGRLRAHLVSEPVTGLDELCLRPPPARAPWESRPSGVLSLIMDLNSSSAAK